MKDRSALFNSPMVRALLNDSKTKTRRIMREQVCEPSIVQISAPGYCEIINEHGVHIPGFHCPYGKPGDRLWVRETHRPIFGQTCGLIAVDYKADPIEKWQRLGDEIGMPTKWIPSIHMRREYSRISLEIVNVRVERLQEISEADCISEGAPGGHGSIPGYGFNATPYEHYRYIWESINGAGSWALNPWVWDIEFKRVKE